MAEPVWGQQSRPRSTDQQPCAARPLRAQPALTVLLADDDLCCRDSLAQLLAHEGFRILCAAGGLEALDVLRPQRAQVHLLVLDYEMPDLTGLQVLRVVREELRLTVPAIVVSGRADVLVSARTERPESEGSGREGSVRQGGGEFALAPKPIEPISFRQLVWHLLDPRLPS